MPSVFDSKVFNGEVFEQYVNRIPNPRKTELMRSTALRPRPDLAAALADQVGGNYITTPLKGLISGNAQNYDGETNLTARKTKGFAHSRVVVGRANAWTEADFSYDITGGVDFLENVAQQISTYWDEVDEDTIVHILNGVFKMSDSAGLEFVQKHTYDVTALTNSASKVGYMDSASLNTAIQKACGDGKGAFSLAIMHSFVATNLENMNLLSYLKYTDANGITRDLALGTVNGRLVLIDDAMPVSTVTTTEEVKGTYTITISTEGVADDTITIGGTVYTFGTTTSAANHTLAVGTSTTTQATALKTVLAAQYDGIFTVTSASNVVTLTQVVGGTGAQPALAKTGTVAAAVAAGTTGVAKVETTTYTTYVLGDGAIEWTDCGAKVPYEMDRNPAQNGGEETLYSRQRKAFAPFGISFTKTSMQTNSPTDAELETGANWELVNSVESDGKAYISHKTIPICRILSLG